MSHGEVVELRDKVIVYVKDEDVLKEMMVDLSP